MKRKVCILGTYHDYQYLVRREGYRSLLKSLIRLHSVDLVAEEANDSNIFFAREVADECAFELKREISWENIDLRREVQGEPQDTNTLQIEPFIDAELQTKREWAWVENVSREMKSSALLICGCAHTFSVSEKFRWAGFDTETQIYFDPQDAKSIRNG